MLPSHPHRVSSICHSPRHLDSTMLQEKPVTVIPAKILVFHVGDCGFDRHGRLRCRCGVGGRFTVAHEGFPWKNGTCLSSIVGLQPSKRRSFPINIGVIWVPGTYEFTNKNQPKKPFLEREIPIPYLSMGLVYLPTWMVAFNGFYVVKHTILTCILCMGMSRPPAQTKIKRPYFQGMIHDPLWS